MAALLVFLLNLVASLFKPKSQLEAENAALRQQLIVLQRKVRSRVQFTQHSLPGGLLGLTWTGLAPADRASFLGAFPLLALRNHQLLNTTQAPPALCSLPQSSVAAPLVAAGMRTR